MYIRRRPAHRFSTRLSRFLLGALGPALLAAAGAGCGGDAPTWAGKTYALNVPMTNWAMPANVGGDIGAFVPNFLISFAAGSAKSLKVTLATAPGAPGSPQDPCNPTTDVMTSVADYPASQIVAALLPMHLVNANDPSAVVAVNTTVHDFTLANVLPGDKPATDGTLTATVDVSEVYPLFTLLPATDRTMDSVCTALGQANAPCETCAFNGQPYCLTLEAVQLGATQTTVSVQPLLASNIPATCSP